MPCPYILGDSLYFYSPPIQDHKLLKNRQLPQNWVCFVFLFCSLGPGPERAHRLLVLFYPPGPSFPSIGGPKSLQVLEFSVGDTLIGLARRRRSKSYSFRVGRSSEAETGLRKAADLKIESRATGLGRTPWLLTGVRGSESGHGEGVRQQAAEPGRVARDGQPAHGGLPGDGCTNRGDSKGPGG